MKIIILAIVLLSFSTQASYMSRSELLNCELEEKVSHTFIKDCSQLKLDCIVIPTNHNCDTFSIIDGKLVEDPVKVAALIAIEETKKNRLKNLVWGNLNNIQKTKLIKYLLRNAPDIQVLFE